MDADHSARNNAVELVERKCPCCGWNCPTRRTGGHARAGGVQVDRLVEGAPIGHLDPEQGVFLRWRNARGGRGFGFPTLRTMTLPEAAQDPRWRPYVATLVAWARRVVALGDRLGL